MGVSEMILNVYTERPTYEPVMPRPDRSAWPHGFHDLYTVDQMREYGAACAAHARAVALEEAVKRCEEHLYVDCEGSVFDFGPDLPANKQMMLCIDAVRKMIEQLKARK